MATRRTLVSLIDIIMYLQFIVAHEQASRINPRHPNIDPKHRQYNCTAFMNAILRDIFDNTAEQHPNEYLRTAKAILQNAGLNPQIAHKLCNDLIDQIVMQISGQLPHLVFHDTTSEVYVDMVNEWDVLVTEHNV